MKQASTIFTDEEIIKIYNEDYVKQHMGNPSLEKKYNCKFYDSFVRLGLPMRNHHDKGKHYFCDSNYFKDIDTSEKAYWFGFCYADGYITNVTENNDALKFGLSIGLVDYQHLVKFKEAIKFSGEIKKYVVGQGYKVGTEYCRILFTDPVFVNNIVSHGLVPKKSNILEPPKGIPKEYIKDFIRGFMDGNGSIMITRNNNNPDYPSYGISFCSTESVLNWIQDYLYDKGILSKKHPLKKRKKEHIISSFNFGGNLQVKKYLDFIYKNATMYLDRKYQRYLSLCNLLENAEANKRVNVCAYCGTAESSEFNIWNHGGEYNQKILCRKHYDQLKKYGYMIPEKKDKCDICGGTHGRLTRVGPSHGAKYHGMTLCEHHYNQLRYYGEIIDKPLFWENEHEQTKCS